MVLNIDQNEKFPIFPPDFGNPEEILGICDFGQYWKSLLEFNFEDMTLIFCSGKCWSVELSRKKFFIPPKSFLPPFLRAALAAWSWIAVFNFQSYVCKNGLKNFWKGGKKLLVWKSKTSNFIWTKNQVHISKNDFFALI